MPISITAFSAEAIADANIYDLRDVVRLSPNVNLQSTGGNGTAGVPQGFAGLAPEKREIGLRMDYKF